MRPLFVVVVVAVVVVVVVVVVVCSLVFSWLVQGVHIYWYFRGGKKYLCISDGNLK